MSVGIVKLSLSFFLWLCLAWTGLAAAAEELSPINEKAGMSREYFVTRYIDHYERRRITESMCSAESFLLKCTGSLTRAYIPEGNGKRLSQDYCKDFFMDRLEQVLRHDKGKTGYFYKQLPLKISNDQARSLRNRLVKDIHGSLVSLLRDQGSVIGQDEKCVYRFLYSVEQVDSMGVVDN